VPSEAIAKGIRSCGVEKAESKVKSLGHLPAPAAVDRDAAFTVEGVKLQESIAQALRSNREFDQVREVLFVREADHLGLATNVTSHLAQSTLSSAILKPSLSSAARKSRSSFATCRTSNGRKSLPCLRRISPTVSVGQRTACREDSRANSHIFWTSHAGDAEHWDKNRPPQRERAAQVSEVR
jgi:hypothetical protein